MPQFGPAHAQVRCETFPCCLRVRSGLSTGILSPQAPRGSAGPAQLFRVRFNPPTLFGPAHAGPFLLAALTIGAAATI